MSESPFSENRFENEHGHLYFLNEAVLARLHQPKSTFMIGARGTGKTTLLHALHWRERAQNEQLRSVLKDLDPFRTPHGLMIGVYQKASDHAFALIDDWADDQAETDASQLRGRYLEVLWLEIVARALADTVADGILELAPEKEQKAMADLCAMWSEVFPVLGAFRPGTLVEMAAALRTTRLRYETAATRRLDPLTVYADLGTPTQTGEFLRDFIVGILHEANRDSDGGPYIKICLDEGEVLRPAFRKIINRLIRTAKWPLFLVISYARLPDALLETDEVSLSILPSVDADFIRLDNSETLTSELGVSFRDYVEGVANVRIRARGEGQISDQDMFSIHSFLGPLNINSILERKLGGKSVSKEGRGLLARARQLEGHSFFVDYQTKDPVETKSPPPPIYQTFLVERLGLILPEEGSPEWQRRGQEAAEIRSRMVAAYMAICDLTQSEVEYSSADMVLNISDGCIRDFLNCLHEIYVTGGCSIQSLHDRRVAPDVQHRALVAASKRKAAGIGDRPLKSIKKVESLASGLALMTARLQRNAPHDRHLTSPERGNVRLRFKDSDVEWLTEIQDALVQAAEWGYLTLLPRRAGEIRFRVHTSLAPAYGFSYRGAYHDAPIRWVDVMTLIRADSRSRVESIVAEWAGRGLDSNDNLSLFETDDDPS